MKQEILGKDVFFYQRQNNLFETITAQKAALHNISALFVAAVWTADNTFVFFHLFISPLSAVIRE